MKKIIVGIDPGLSGAIGAIDASTGEFIAGEDLSVVAIGKTKHIDGGELAEFIHGLILLDSSVEVYIERVSAMPGQGVTSMFNFGGASLGILVALGALGIPFTMVTPQSWKKAVGIPAGSDKGASLSRARQLFPAASLKRQKDHALADALLIARFGFIEQGGGH